MAAVILSSQTNKSLLLLKDRQNLQGYHENTRLLCSLNISTSTWSLCNTSLLFHALQRESQVELLLLITKSVWRTPLIIFTGKSLNRIRLHQIS